MPEVLMEAVRDLEAAYHRISGKAAFKKELSGYLRDYAGRPTRLTPVKSLSDRLGARVYLKREDLLHTGSHKINNTLGQVILARWMGKKRIIAETGAGQHGVATATVAALFKIPCVVYMGAEDVKRQELNVYRMRLLGAEVRSVESGSRTLKDAINEALRDWIQNVRDTYYVIGSVMGPHPYPLIVRNFQKVIGEEVLRQLGRAPDTAVACVGGGSNAIGLFHALRGRKTRLVGVEAAGDGIKTGHHAATLTAGRVGILHGSRSYVLQDAWGQIMEAHSISAGLDYPGVGPEHAFLRDSGRAVYVSCTDKQALEGFKFLSREEGIIPALESSHAVGFLLSRPGFLKKRETCVICLSGRGDKDVQHASRFIRL